MRRWILTCSLIMGLVAVLCVAVILGLVWFGRLAESLPMPSPRPTLVVGKTYWIGALMPPPGVPAGLVLRYASLYNKPGGSIKDPSVTWIGSLRDATGVKLTGIRDKWCYVETPDDQEGWLDCNWLLDYEPTPVPTPDRTPEKP